MAHFIWHCREQFEVRKVLIGGLCTVQGVGTGCYGGRVHVMFGTS
jgi:hypothetical protein